MIQIYSYVPYPRVMIYYTIPHEQLNSSTKHMVYNNEAIHYSLEYHTVYHSIPLDLHVHGRVRTQYSECNRTGVF